VLSWHCMGLLTAIRDHVVILAMTLICAGAASSLPAQTLTTARDIAAHLTPKDAQPARVSLEATVTFVDPRHTIFLRDDTGATFITGNEGNPRVERGERLLIEGDTHNGLFIGGIRPTRIERLSKEPPVEPRPVTPDDLASGRFHYQWVTITGVGRSLRGDDEATATLRLLTGGKTVELRFDEVPPDATALIDAELRVRGLAAGDINDRRQLVVPYIRVTSMADVTIVKPPPADPFAAPTVQLIDLQRASADGHRVKILGVALAPPVAGGLFLRDEERSVFVQSTAPGAVKAGDVVEALGFPEMGIFSAQLSDAQCRVVETRAVPVPLPVGVKELTDGTDSELVTVDADVLQRIDREAHTEVLAQVGPVSLTVFCPGRAASELQAGSRVRVTGPCRVTSTKSNAYRARPTAYHVWLIRMTDLAILQRAPWWNPQRLALGLGGAAALALIALLWATQLRIQVRSQLAVIEAKAQREAITEERQRIAREFHDTLEQELAGLSLRLDAAATRVTDEKARSLLEQQRRLLTRLQTETRDFVWDLRDPTANDTPSDEALASLLSHLQVTTTIPLKLSILGRPPALPPLAQNHLLRIAREAVHNAIKYSQATAIEVSLDEGDEVVKLEVTDNGAGFEVSKCDALENRFGIRGMRERAKKTGAKLEIESTPGTGTRVALTMPVSQAVA
jgi:signal transduction histidine kinase